MKPKRVTTLNVGKFKPVFQFVKNSGTVLLLSLLLVIISCDKSDDLDNVGNESPIQNESPTDNESIIVYTDIEPDFNSENPYYYYDLDLNNDQNVDFTVRSNGDAEWGAEWLEISSNPTNGHGIWSVAEWHTAFPLNSGVEIFKTAYYRTTSYFKIDECFGCNYSWKDKLDKYLGLRFIIDGKTHYGWVRLDITSFTQWVIKDYAYNATPNKPILAGQRE